MYAIRSYYDSMQVDDTLLSKLEKLSYLQVSDDKRAEIIAQMDEMIAFVDVITSYSIHYTKLYDALHAGFAEPFHRRRCRR